jgi:hypothetical protein
VTCEEARENAWALALGALSPEEARAWAEHEAHPECRRVLEEARGVVMQLAHLVPPVAAPASLSPTLPQRGRGRVVFAAMAIAAVVIAVVAWLAQPPDSLDAATALAAKPGATVILLGSSQEVAAQSSAEGRAILHAGRGYVVADRLPRGEGAFQIWVIRGTVPSPAGFLSVRADRSGVGEIDPAQLTSRFDVVAVTLEPNRGNVLPTGPMVLVGAPRG